MKSCQLDSFLRLENSAGVELAMDDDGGGFPNARIVFRPAEAGKYRVIATSYKGGAGRYYVLVLRREK